MLIHVLRSTGSAAMASAIFLPLASCHGPHDKIYLRATDSAIDLISLALPAVLVVAGAIFVRYARLLAALHFAAGLLALACLYLVALFSDKWLIGGYLAMAGVALVLSAGILEMIMAIIRWRQRRRARRRAKERRAKRMLSPSDRRAANGE